MVKDLPRRVSTMEHPAYGGKEVEDLLETPIITEFMESVWGIKVSIL